MREAAVGQGGRAPKAVVDSALRAIVNNAYESFVARRLLRREELAAATGANQCQGALGAA